MIAMMFMYNNTRMAQTCLMSLCVCLCACVRACVQVSESRVQKPLPSESASCPSTAPQVQKVTVLLVLETSAVQLVLHRDETMSNIQLKHASQVLVAFCMGFKHAA